MNGRAQDITGLTFGKLKVIARADSDKIGNSRWTCLCDCGVIAIAVAAQLRNGNKYSCGCTWVESQAARSRAATIIAGTRFGRLTVGEEVDPVFYSGCGQKSRRYRCVCDCGTSVIVARNHLRSGDTTSCGCLIREKLIAVNTKHGHAKQRAASLTYRSWSKMLQRCRDSKNNRYAMYGGRGIKVCDRWVSSFADFLADVGPRPSKTHSIDRIEVDGDYEPGNCKWSTALEQRHNQRRCTSHSAVSP